MSEKHQGYTKNTLLEHTLHPNALSNVALKGEYDSVDHWGYFQQAQAEILKMQVERRKDLSSKMKQFRKE